MLGGGTKKEWPPSPLTWSPLSDNLCLSFIYGFWRCKLPVQLHHEFFITGLIGFHYLAYKIFKWKLNNRGDTRFGKKRTYYFSSVKINFRINDSLFPNLKHDINYPWEMKTELGVVSIMLNMCSFPKSTITWRNFLRNLPLSKLSST